MGGGADGSKICYLRAECRCPIYQRKFMRWIGANCCTSSRFHVKVINISGFLFPCKMNTTNGTLVRWCRTFSVRTLLIV